MNERDFERMFDRLREVIMRHTLHLSTSEAADAVRWIIEELETMQSALESDAAGGDE
jgi:hypothetical protein